MRCPHRCKLPPGKLRRLAFASMKPLALEKLKQEGEERTFILSTGYMTACSEMPACEEVAQTSINFFSFVCLQKNSYKSTSQHVYLGSRVSLLNWNNRYSGVPQDLRLWAGTHSRYPPFAVGVLKKGVSAAVGGRGRRRPRR